MPNGVVTTWNSLLLKSSTNISNITTNTRAQSDTKELLIDEL